MMNRSRIKRLTMGSVLLLGLACVWSGCEKPSSPPPVIRTKPARKEVTKAQTTAKKTASMKRPVFSYNPQGLVDPFKPFIQIGSAGKTVVGIPKTPLQEYDLSQLKLTAIIVIGEERSFAMVEDSAGKGFTLRKGTYIGKRGGRVKRIQTDRVIVEEPLSPYAEESAKREVVIKMPEEGGVK